MENILEGRLAFKHPVPHPIKAIHEVDKIFATRKRLGKVKVKDMCQHLIRKHAFY